MPTHSRDAEIKKDPSRIRKCHQSLFLCLIITEFRFEVLHALSIHRKSKFDWKSQVRGVIFSCIYSNFTASLPVIPDTIEGLYTMQFAVFQCIYYSFVLLL